MAQDSVILMIGDGMGPGQVKAGSIHAHGSDGKLVFQSFPVKGNLVTGSADNKVTDSAAAGTALATGKKTNNGMIAQSPEGNKLTTILELCRDDEKATGLIATSTITHATPASFAAHHATRKAEAELAVGMLESKPSLMFGGGAYYFSPKSVETSKRKDERDLLAEAALAGYRVIDSKQEMDELRGGDEVLGLFADGSLGWNDKEPTLAEMTGAALSVLDADEDGFFLMVEGSQIDWACHENKPDYFYSQMASFEEAVKIAFEFAKADGNVLLVVTADHETGGMSISDEKGPVLAWSTKGHTAARVPLYAYGPGSEKLGGERDNTDVPKLIAEALGLSF